MSQLDIIIVNWNAGQQLRDCLESLVRVGASVNLGQVVVVDNASCDGSADNLESMPLPVVVIRNDSNRGFGAACNQGATVCGSKYLLFLNPDTVVGADSLLVPLQFMNSEENADVGVCGIQLVDSDGHVSKTCARVPTPSIFAKMAMGLPQIAPRWFSGMQMSEWNHDETRLVDQVIGAFYFIRRQLFADLHGFDERFFVYFEEVDLSKAVIDHGYRIIYLTSATAFHQGGGTSERVKARRLFYSRRSRIQYAFKHFSPLAAVCAALLTLIIEPFAMIARGAVRRSPQEIGQTISGFAMLWGDLPNIFSSRSKHRSFVLDGRESSQLATRVASDKREAA